MKSEKQIESEINSLYVRLQEVVDPSVFEYTEEIRSINERIAELQRLCPHTGWDVDGGICYVCKKRVQR